MKAFEDLTDRELVSLTEIEVSYYIDRACAQDGVPLLPPKPPTPPPAQPVEDDVMVYRVAGLAFSDVTEAGRVRDVLLGCLTFGVEGYLHISGNYRRTWKPSQSGLTDKGIETITLLSEDRAARYGQQLQAHGALVKGYEDADKVWKKAVEGRANVESDIADTLEAARTRDRQQREIGTLYSRYLELANDDHEIAARFLRKAEPEAPTIMPELFLNDESVMPPPADHAVIDAEVDVIADDIPY